MQETLTFRRTTSDDAESLVGFYAEMIDSMKGTDFDVLWKHDSHPSHDFLRKSAANGEAIIGLTADGEIACALVVDNSPSPGYENVPWKIDAPAKEVGVLHVVATLPKYHGKGYARALMNSAIELSREAGQKALRLDTFTTNERAQNLYSSLGFEDMGTWPIFHADLGTVDLKMYELGL